MNENENENEVVVKKTVVENNSGEKTSQENQGARNSNDSTWIPDNT